MIKKLRIKESEMSNLKIAAAKSQAKDYISQGYDPKEDVEVITSELTGIGHNQDYIDFVLNKMEELKDKECLYRIDYYGSWDNGRVFHSFKKGTLDNAEGDAKIASKKDPENLYYVVLDDIMNPTTGWYWYRGKRYNYRDPELNKIKRTINNSKV